MKLETHGSLAWGAYTWPCL